MVVLAVALGITSCSAKAESGRKDDEIHSLEAQIDSLEIAIDDLKNGSSRLLEKIQAAWKEEDWKTVVSSYKVLHEKFPGSAEDREAAEKYLPKAQDEVQKEEEAKKAAEEEKRRQEEEQKKAEEEKKRQEEEEAANAKAAAEEEAKRTASQKNAIRKAESYLSFTAFSRGRLIEQLEYEGFSNEDAVYAVDHINVDWNEQAYEKAKSYLEWGSFSEARLIEQLEFEGFTSEQAAYGANKAYSE